VLVFVLSSFRGERISIMVAARTAGALLFAAALLTLCPAAARAQFYQYRDSRGNMVITDHPPAGSHAEEKLLKDDGISWSSRGEADMTSSGETAGEKPEPAARPDYSRVTVVMYRTNWCGYCKQVAAYVRSLGAGLVEYDIDRDPEKKAEMRRKSGGSSSVPLIDIDGTIIRGFSAPAIKAAVERSASR
jgi:mycoredoxin